MDFETISEEYLKRIDDIIARRMGDSVPVDGMNCIPVIIGCGTDYEAQLDALERTWGFGA